MLVYHRVGDERISEVLNKLNLIIAIIHGDLNSANITNNTDKQ